MRSAPALILLMVFLVLAAAMISGATLPFDMAFRGAIHKVSSSDLTALARSFSLVGSAFMWVPMAILVAGALWLMRRRKQAIAIALAMLGAILVDNGLKLLFHRARPEVFFGVSPVTYSFPSGHALFATCFYGALAAILAREIENTLWRGALWSAAILMALSIGWSRIYLGVHFPSDVLAGYLTGASWLAVLNGLGTFRFPGDISLPKSSS
jgi:undecaprenyl-diphosphatase